MAQINVTNLTFGYDGSFDYIFENVSFSVDTDWKLGFIGRNGKGKTTFLHLLLGKYEYTGSILTNVVFDYFPYEVASEDLDKNADDLMDMWKPGVESWRVMCELPQLSLDPEVLYRPFRTLSFGERTKVMLAVLFSGENDFLLIDEPTNHLDMASREIVKRYLAGKKGFILVSHDRDLLDAYIGAKTKKMQSRVKTFENRIGREIEEKEGLLKDLEEPVDLKIMPLRHHKQRLIECRDFSLKYQISYVIQDTSHLKGSLREHAVRNGLDYTLFLTLLKQLDLERAQFDKDIEEYSDGQKKKVLIASSLLTPAHLYIWDEPLNYIDVFSRIQIETLIEQYKPTMLIVEHDVRFKEKLAMKEVRL